VTVDLVVIDGTRVRAKASHKVAFLGDQAIPADFGPNRQFVVASELVGSVTLV
jgi:hypothetical protein